MKPSVSQVEAYIREAIRKWVWSGFYSPDEVDSMIDDILEGASTSRRCDPRLLSEFARKAEEERNVAEGD